MTVTEAEELVRTGAEALGRGDAAGARKCFERVASAGLANAQIWLLLAHACGESGDPAAQEDALDRLLQFDPGSLRGLISKGDCRVTAGDKRAATAFYKRALAIASSLPRIPDQLETEIRRVSEWLSEAEQAYARHLSKHIRETLSEGEISARFQQSLDILSGKRQLYHQQPSAYYFPELPQRQFFEAGEFDWSRSLGEATEAIVSELAQIMASSEEMFHPYLQTTGARPHVEFGGLDDNPDWSTFYLWRDGRKVEANALLCPRTVAVVEGLPLPHITTRAPAVFFSRLRAGARIPPHTGMVNTRLICHLPLIVPPGCGFRVGNETREWKVGELLIFDDTIEHEAWNESSEDRVVLIFDIWRPEISIDERRAVTAMFEAVDRY